jgi:hypothetical protein
MMGSLRSPNIKCASKVTAISLLESSVMKKVVF